MLIVYTHCCFLRLLKPSSRRCCPPPRLVPHQLALVKVLVAMLREPLLLLWVPVTGTPSCLSQGLAVRAVACGNEVGLGEELGNVLDPNLTICSFVCFSSFVSISFFSWNSRKNLKMSSDGVQLRLKQLYICPRKTVVPGLTECLEAKCVALSYQLGVRMLSSLHCSINKTGMIFAT